MLTLSSRTFGCKLNQSETEGAVATLFATHFSKPLSDEDPDVYLINTCTVTSRGEGKARTVIRGLLRRETPLLIIVTGCYARTESKRLSEIAPEVFVVEGPPTDLCVLLEGVAPPTSIKELKDILKKKRGVRDIDSDFPFALNNTPVRSRFFLKIQDGCDRVCAYCRVKIARGKSRFLEIDEIINRFRKIVERGYTEVVLTGVHIDSYPSLGLLLKRLTTETQGARIRLTSLDPYPGDDDFFVILRHPRICPHFHVSLQSGSSSVLKRMRRNYSSQQAFEFIQSLKETSDDPHIAADIITGFPGETDDDFAETVSFVHSVGFSSLHVFSYSPRPGTEAFSMSGGVQPEIIKKRTSFLKAIGDKALTTYSNRQKGLQLNLLVEQKRGNILMGTTENYLKAKVSETTPPTDLRSIILVHIENLTGTTLEGVVLKGR